MKKAVVIHPFFLAIFPILFLYAHNINQVSFSETWLATLVVLLMTACLFLFLKFILKKSQKAAIIVSLFLILCFSFGHVLEFLRAWQKLNVITRESRYLFGFWCLLFFLGLYFLIKTRRNLSNLTIFLNIVGLSLVGVSLINISVYRFRVWSSRQSAGRSSGLEVNLGEKPDAEKLPDIYYLVFDRYTRADVLKEIYDFDNQEFIDYLTDKGFYVAKQSNANYMTTPHSLGSSLNMKYLDFLTEEYGQQTDDFLPLRTIIEDNQLWRFLKSKRYQYIHFGSSWEATRKNRYADVNIDWYSMPEFSMMLYQSSIFYPVGIQLRIFDFRFIHWQRVLYEFDKLAETAEMPGPKFVFAHMMIPHDPFAFDKNGEFLTEEEAGKREPYKNYINQIIFLNKKIKKLIDELLADSENLPIIVLQSDEGQYSSRFWLAGEVFNWGEREVFNWQEASKAELKEKMGILNAYFLPGKKKDILYPSITPVNSFRLIFNLYFDANFEILPDKSYVSDRPEQMYKFTEVTDKLGTGKR